MRLLAAMTVFILSGAAISGDAVDEESDDVYGLGIDIGRLGVINDRTQEIWLKMRSDQSHYRHDDPTELSSSLRYIVWNYNQLREQLCSDRFMVDQSCGPPFVPKWMFESQKVVPSAKELQARQDELADRVIPLWDAACERLRKVIERADTQQYCSVE